MAITKEQAIERAFDRCNLIGENVDILHVMYQYKAIRELPETKSTRSMTISLTVSDFIKSGKEAIT
jgi:hypothetical protein